MSRPNHLVLIRHGLSEDNHARFKAKQGNLDFFDEGFRNRLGPEVRLMPEGVEQAKNAGLWVQEHIIKRYGLIGFDKYVYSPHIRTRETAANLGLPEADWEMDRRLRERSWGEIEKLSRDEFEQAHPINYDWHTRDSLYWKAAGGESMAEIADGRVTQFINSIGEGNDEGEIESVVAITHGEWMAAARLILEHMLNEQWEEGHKDSSTWIQNCQVNHYTRLEPNTGIQAPDYKWVRYVNAGLPDQDQGEWQEITKPALSNEELLDQVSKIPRLWPNS